MQPFAQREALSLGHRLSVTLQKVFGYLRCALVNVQLCYREVLLRSSFKVVAKKLRYFVVLVFAFCVLYS